MKKRVYKITLGFAGFISGVFSFLLVAKFDQLLQGGKYFKLSFLSLGAGVVWGIIIFLLLLIFPSGQTSKKLPVPLKFFFWTISSTVAYYLAFLTTNFLTSLLSSPHQEIPSTSLPLFAGGFLGGLIVLFAFNIFYCRISKKVILLLAVVSGFLGQSFIYGSLIEFSFFPFTQNNVGLLPLYVVWQTGMAFALGWIIDKKQKIQSSISH